MAVIVLLNFGEDPLSTAAGNKLGETRNRISGYALNMVIGYCHGTLKLKVKLIVFDCSFINF
jgi:hypothetical protein